MSRYIYNYIQKHRELRNDVDNILNYDLDAFIIQGDLDDLEYNLKKNIEDAKQEAIDEAGSIKDDLEEDISNLEDDINSLQELKDDVLELKIQKSLISDGIVKLATSIVKLATKLDWEDEIYRILKGN